MAKSTLTNETNRGNRFPLLPALIFFFFSLSLLGRQRQRSICLKHFFLLFSIHQQFNKRNGIIAHFAFVIQQFIYKLMAATSYTALPSSSYVGLSSDGDPYQNANFGKMTYAK